MRGTVRFAWREADPAKGFAAGVSLHSHTSHSRECLADLPRWVSGVPIVSWELRRLARRYACRYGALPDFSAAYWTPPLRSAQAIDLEREAISDSLDLPAFVSVTDHDTIAAGLEAADSRTVPISVEWTVPFQQTYFHFGIHNLAAVAARGLMAELATYTARPCDDRLRELLAALNADPGVLIVLNHPFWDQRGIGPAQHATAQQNLIRACASGIHAMELNGLRSWDENQLTYRAALEFGLPVVSGGDRHGCEPNAVINLTTARDFSEFVSEVRDGVSHVMFLRHYCEPLRLRIFRAINDVLCTGGDAVSPERWADRVFYARDGGCARALSSIWTRKPPRVVRLFVRVVRLAGREEVQRPLRRLCAAVTAAPMLAAETTPAVVEPIDGAAV